MVFALMLATFGFFGLWHVGDRRSLWISVAGVTLLLLLKETAIIHLGCFALAAVVMLFWEENIFQSAAPQQWNQQDFFKALSIAFTMLFVFYSGFFLNTEGLLHLFQTIPAWIQTGTGASGHEKWEYQIGWFNFYWIALMMRYEWPSLLGFFYAIIFLMQKRTTILMRYFSLYAIGVLAAYSLIPYKTPWCVISIIWPFALLFGVGLCSIKCERLFFGIAGVALLASLVFCLQLNFWHYVDFSEPYVYVQTSPEIKRITETFAEP